MLTANVVNYAQVFSSEPVNSLRILLNTILQEAITNQKVGSWDKIYLPPLCNTALSFKGEEPETVKFTEFSIPFDYLIT